MKKKHRNITVNDITYGWTIRSFGKEKYVTVWKNKKPWINEAFRKDSVTPQDVKEIIVKKTRLVNVSANCLYCNKEIVGYGETLTLASQELVNELTYHHNTHF